MIKTEAAPHGAMVSDAYRVYVKSLSEDKEREISVYTALTADGTTNVHKFPPEFCKEFDGLEYGTIATKTYFASFDADEEVQVRIVCAESVSAFFIKPETLQKSFQQNGNSLTFTILPGEKSVIEANGNIFNSLKLFCNPISIPENKKENYIEFKPGYYTSQNCKYIQINEHGIPVIDNIPDNTTVYIHDGAVLCAAVVLCGKHNIKICGRGIISMIERCYGADCDFSVRPLYGGFRYHALPNIYICSGCSNIEIEGIILNCEFRGIVLRNSEEISISNVKMFSSCVNADGINISSTKKLLIQDCFIQSSDDCIAVFTACDSIPTFADSEYKASVLVSADIEARNCILSTCSRPFVVGGHATGAVNPHDLIENITFRDIEVIDIASSIYGVSEEIARYWFCIFRVLSQTEQYIRNILFQNIRVNRTRGFAGKPVHIEVRSDQTASYSEKRGYKIENVRFDGIHLYNCPPKIMNSDIFADFGDDNVNSDYGIDGVWFNNFDFDRIPIKYNENYILTKGNVSNINIL